MTDSDGTVSAAELIQHARSSIERAYVRYSDFAVAAAVVDEHGRIFTGVNVENASYGLTICAERVAIFTAIAAGARRITALAVTAKKLSPIAPCGACRQVMVEFCEAGTPVYSDTGSSKPVEWTVGELLPRAFTSTDALQSGAGERDQVL